jgi:hypothetical protein
VQAAILRPAAPKIMLLRMFISGFPLVLAHGCAVS